MSALKQTQQGVLDNTKNSNTNYPKSLFSISDVNRIYRRQQTYRKKLKTLMQTNCLLEARIKIYESTIKDERSTILFQLNELSKTMNNKISTYVDEKLDKEKFKDNQQAVETIKEMISKFQTVQRQTKVTKKVYQNLNSIFQRYEQYSEEINNLVRMTEKSNKQYEDGMKNMLTEKQNQIVAKRQNNQDIYDNTQTMIKKIDQYQAQRLKLIDEEAQLEKYIEKLNKIQQQTKLEVDRFTEWAQIVIDKNHRKVFNKQSKEKQTGLHKILEDNKKLQVYLKQLENQEQLLKNRIFDKENQISLLTKVKTVRNTKQKNKTIASNFIHPKMNKGKNIFVP